MWETVEGRRRSTGPPEVECTAENIPRLATGPTPCLLTVSYISISSAKTNHASSQCQLIGEGFFSGRSSRVRRRVRVEHWCRRTVCYCDDTCDSPNYAADRMKQRVFDVQCKSGFASRFVIASRRPIGKGSANLEEKSFSARRRNALFSHCTKPNAQTFPAVSAAVGAQTRRARSGKLRTTRPLPRSTRRSRRATSALPVRRGSPA